MTSRVFPMVRSWLPRSVGAQCLLGLVLGIVVAWLWPGLSPWLAPFGQIFLRASQIAVMPYLLCELVGSLGGLSRPSLRLLARFGGLVLLVQLLVGSLLVLWLPSLLPHLNTSPLFQPQMLLNSQPPDLIATFLPFNIFTALAQDNFPAAVLFATVVGVVLQGLPRRQVLLEPLEQLRLLFRRINGLVIRLAPVGVLALTTTTLGAMTGEQLLRSQALLLINVVALVVLTILFVVVMLSLTPLSLRTIWQVLRGPLVLVASSANLMIALPMLNESLREALGPFVAQQDGERRDRAFEEIAALVPVGFALPTLGQVVNLVFVPFCAWFVDRPMDHGAVLRMLLTGIPSVAGGLKSAVRQELLAASLPVDLVALVNINAEWLYREEKVLSLLGLVLLVVLVVIRSLGLLRLRRIPLLTGLPLTLLVALGLGGLCSSVLIHQLQGTYHHDQTLLNRRLLLPRQPTTVLRPDQLQPAPVGLAEIRRRGVLRVGLQQDSPPWAYRNSQGQIVGYDIDMLEALARTLEVNLALVPVPLPQLDSLLREQKIDLAAGGIQNTPVRASENAVSAEYQQVHLALLVPDERLDLIQNLAARPLRRPLRLGVSDPSLIGVNLRDQLAALLGPPGRPIPLQLRQMSGSRPLSGPEGAQVDGMLVTAEGGSALALLDPSTSMLTVFGSSLPEQLVLLIGGKDPVLRDYIDTWLARKADQGFLQRLYQHWVLLQDGTGWKPSAPSP